MAQTSNKNIFMWELEQHLNCFFISALLPGEFAWQGSILLTHSEMCSMKISQRAISEVSQKRILEEQQDKTVMAYVSPLSVLRVHKQKPSFYLPSYCCSFCAQDESFFFKLFCHPTFKKQIIKNHLQHSLVGIQLVSTG